MLEHRAEDAASTRLLPRVRESGSCDAPPTPHTQYTPPYHQYKPPTQYTPILSTGFGVS